MEHHYKDYRILISTWARLDPDGFTPEFRISTKAHRILHTLKVNQIFPTREEAEGCGLEGAKRWIDDRLHRHVYYIPLSHNAGCATLLIVAEPELFFYGLMAF